MQPIDICYTPLDIPKRPDVDIAKFLSWAQSVYPQSCKSKSDNAEDVIGKDYPWDLVWGAWDGIWQNNFDKEFPELAVYCYEAFKIHRHELSGAIFLPVRSSVKGVSFWHNDVDPTGFRFYLECEHYNDNPLLFANIESIRVTAEVVQAEIDGLPPLLNVCLESTPAPANIARISATFETSQELMSWLNTFVW